MSDVERLALAVIKANGNAKLIAEDNEGGQWLSVSEAVDSGSAFLVEVKKTLIALDLDSPELMELGKHAQSLAEDSGLPTLLVDSGRNQHLYIRADKQKSIIVEHLKDLGIPGSVFRSAIRPPLSPHRMGLATSLISPETVEEALAVLGPREEPRYLSQETIRLLEQGDTEGRFEGNRSRVALSIAASLRMAGETYDHFRLAMLNREHAGGMKAQELEEVGSNVEDFLRRTWEKAGKAEEFVPESVEEVIPQLRAAIEAASWKGKKGTTDKAVMLALCSLAESYTTTAPTFGLRTLTEVAQLGSVNTTRKALSRLVAAQWIAQRTYSSQTEAHSYQLRTVRNDTPITSGGTVLGVSVLTHPAFRDGSGLGKSVGAVWVALSEHGPCQARELVSLSERSQSTVERSLKRLESFGLAQRSEGLWQAQGAVEDLDRIAEQTGAAETARRQAEAHETARQLYRQPQPVQEPEELTEDDKRRIEEELRSHGLI